MLTQYFDTRFGWLLLLLLMLTACSGNSMQSAYKNDFHNALNSIGYLPENDSEVAAHFVAIFNQAQHGDVASLIEETYAESLYFNDTFHTITDRDELIRYMQKTGQQVDSLEVKIEDIARSEQDIYVRWVMRMQFTVMSKKVDSESIGVSQLRFNQDGKIIMHQDFWDGVDGFYQHLPIIGFSLRKIREKL